MSNLTGTDKSVILLMTIGEDRAAEVFKHLSQREVQTLSAAMANVTQISNKQLTDVLAEFEQEAEQFAALNINANDYLRSVLVKALGEERAASLLEDILETRDTASGIETLNFMEPQSAADLIRDEHPQIIATILVHLKRAQAADILALFDERLRHDVMLRIATFGGVQPAALAELTGGGDHTAAKISCFHDPKAANADVDGMGLKNTGGYIFYDGNNNQWLDPGKAVARDYVCGIAREAAELGFDELILTDVSYPTAGKLDKIDLSNAQPGEDGTDGRQLVLARFLREVRSALPEGVILSLELPSETVRAGYDTDAGQALSTLAPLVDRVYVRTTAADVPALETAVKAASPECGFVPELTERPAETVENWLIIEN